MKDCFHFARVNAAFSLRLPHNMPFCPGVEGEVENGKMGDCREFLITLIRPSLACSDM